MITQFEHITLTTGHTRMSSRAEMDQYTIDLVKSALEQNKPMIDWYIAKERSAAGVHIFRLDYKEIPFVRCWLCNSAAESCALWSAATIARSASAFFDVPPVRQPLATPWLAAEILWESAPKQMQKLGALATMEQMKVVGDLERCVAWALLL